jgi:hypothetical protein
VTKSDKITKNKEKGKEEDKHGDKKKKTTFTYCGKEGNTALKCLNLLIPKYHTN